MRTKIINYFVLTFIIALLILFGSPRSNKLAESPPIPINDETLEKYLNKEIMPPSHDGEFFNSYEILRYDTNRMELYIWAVIQEYYNDSDRLELGSGMSGPIVLEIEGESGSVNIHGHILPRDGSYYEKDIKSLFPKELQKTILDFPDDLVKKLSIELEGKVKESFDKVNDVQIMNIKENSSVNFVDTEIVKVFEEAIEEATLVPGIVNMANPEYKLEIGGETYFLWLRGKNASIMNTMETNKVYRISENSTKAISLIIK